MTTTTEDHSSERPRVPAAAHVPPLPEQGQIVNVRGATWAVADVRAQGLPRSPADEAEAGLTHVVRLQSLDEDRLGQELAVVWELEVGQTVAPDQGLPETISPDGFDDPNTLAAFVDAVRWGAVTSADGNAFQAPFRSGANVEAYQLEPLRRALQSARTNLLLADDVGLGKTIEAGLVMQELLLRHRARSVVIVCPPSLSLKWRDEMREKFGLEFEIVNSELMARVLRTHGPNANPFRLFPRVIVSMAWLPSLRAQRLLRQVYADVRDTSTARRYAFDVLIVDEAHHVAPASPTAATGFRGYAVDSQRTVATRELAERCEHRLFLSATPHNGYSESFTALMEMIDGRRFKRGANLDERALRDIAVRRLKADLADVKGFRTRELKTLAFTPSKDEAEKFALLDRDPRRERPAQRAGQVGRHRGDAVQEAVPVQPVVVRADPAAVHRVRRRIGSRSRRRGPVLPGGPRQRAVRRGRGRHPAPRVHRPAAQQGLGPAGGRDGQGHRVADRLGPGVREPARRQAHRADPVPGRHLPSRRIVEQRASRGVHRVRRDPGLDRPGPWPARLPRRQRTGGHPGLDARRGTGGHPREVHRPAGQAAGPRPGRHRLRRRGHRPAGLLPPAGELRHPVQPVPPGAADRPDRPLRPGADAGDLPAVPGRERIRVRAGH